MRRRRPGGRTPSTGVLPRRHGLSVRRPNVRGRWGVFPGEMVTRVVTSEPSERALDFRSFFEAEYERLLKTMVIVTGSRTEAEDIAQEAMARAFERWDSVSSAASPAGYVFATAFNLHRSGLRRAARGLRLRLREPSAASDPETASVMRVDVLAALRELPRTQLEAVLLVEWLGVTSEEAGRILGIDPASVRGRIHRAREVLRDRLKGEDDG